MRAKSLADVQEVGAATPPEHFPLLDGGLRPRSTDAVVRRIGVLSAVAATAYGCQPAVARAWVAGEGLDEALSDTEVAYLLAEAHSPDDEEAARPEAIFALAWAVQLIPDALDFTVEAPNHLVKAVPHPPPDPQGVEAAVTRAHLRSKAELIAALDLAFCLHWGVVEATLRGTAWSSRAVPLAIVERRRALEWLLSSEDWDEVSLDT
ncbi:MAG TPA: DUF4272 domain-containing protein [Acidimicrobiales bacterium]|nr:DUF4272 domain-containing protein [Acidimicrobiales bacterium]